MTSEIKTLLVEDDQPTRQLLEKLLLAHNHQVTPCANAETALQAYQKKQYSLVIIDWLLPEMDGLRLCREIRRTPQGNQSVILVVTANDQPEDLQKVLEAGADDYLAKPVDTKLFDVRVSIAEKKIDNIQKRLFAEQTSKKAQKALQDSEERYRMMAETATDAIITIDEKSNILFVNSAIEKIFGYSKEEITNKPVTILMPESLRNLHTESLAKYIKSKKRNIPWLSVEMMGLHKSGNEIPIELSFSEFKRDGKLFFTGIVRNIIHRKQAEEALKAAKVYAQNLINSSLDMIISVDRDYKIIEFNRAAEVIFGYSKQDVQGKYVDILYANPEDGRKVYRETQEKNRLNFETKNRRKDGTIFYSWLSASVLNDEKGIFQGIMSVSRDISDWKNAQEVQHHHFKQTKELRNVVEKLNRAYSLDDVYTAAIQGIIAILNADKASVLLYDPDNVVRFKAWEGLSAQYRIAVGGHFPWDKSDLKAQPISISDVSKANLSEELKAAVMNEGIHAFTFIPLVGKDELLGKFMAYYNQQHIFESNEIHVAKVLADNLSAAIERLQDREAIRTSEEKYRKIVETSHDLIWTMDLNGDFTFINRRGIEIIGSDIETIVKTNTFDLIHPDDLTTVKKHFLKVIRNGEVQTFELRIKNKNDEDITLLVTEIPLNENDDIVGVMAFGLDITARKQTEEELGKLSEAVKQSGDIVIITNTNGVIEYVNPAFEKQTGYTSIEVIGKTERILESGKHSEVFFEELWNTILSGKTFRAEFISKKKDGTLFYEAKTITPIMNQQGKITHFVTTSKDITNRKETEEEILRLSAFPKENPHPVFRTDLNGKVQYANPAAKNIMQEMGASNKNIAWLLPKNLKQIIAKLIKKKKSTATSEYRRKDRFFHSEIHLPAGMNVAHIYLTDITERTQQEETSRRLSTAVEQAAESIIITDTVGTIQYVNPAFVMITGYSRDEAIGNNMTILSSGKYNKTFYRNMLDTLRHGEVWISRMTNRKKDGTLYEEEMTISPVRSARAEIVNYVTVGRDVTQEVALEDQLRQAQKLEAIGRLAGGIAHDFNNILTGIIGYADLSLGCLPREHNLRSNLEAIIKKSDDAAILIRQLLAFSRKQILDIRQLDLNHDILQSSQFLKRVLRDDINLVTHLYSNPSIVNADSTAIQQIITNLCVNAQDAMPTGGSIVIETINVPLDEEFCRTRSDILPGEYIKLSITDTGIGMDNDVREHIYEPFFTTKEVGEGSGLGLSTVYGLVKQHKGYIECHTKLGEGTTFDLYFPASYLSIHLEQKVEMEQAFEGKETILIVEDDIDVLNILKSILEHSGYSTLIAKNGFDGLKILKEKRDLIDLIVTDVFMPEMSGIELYHKVNELSEDIYTGKNNIRFLFITGHASLKDKFKIEPGMELLQKPFTSSRLTQKIRELLIKDDDE